MKTGFLFRLLVLWAIACYVAGFVIESDYQVELGGQSSGDGREDGGILFEGREGEEMEEEDPSNGEDKTLRRLVRIKTFTLPTRTRTRPVWYRPDWPSNKNSSIASTINPATLNSTTTSSSTESTTTNLPSTPDVVDTTMADSTSPTELVQQEKWLLEAIEEVAQSVQDDLTPYQDVDQIIVTEMPETQVVKEAISQENSLLFNTASSKAPASIILSTVTSTPNPASISSAPLWIYGSRPTTAKPFVNRWTAPPAKRGGVTVGLSRFGGTVKPSSVSFSTTTRSKPVSLITAPKTRPTPHPTTTHHKVQRSTTSQTRDSSSGIPVTTEWWVSKPNFQFASLSAQDQGDVYDYETQTDEEFVENFASELPPPISNPHFNQGDKSRPSVVVPSTSRRPLASQPPTPREPGIVQITTRPTTVRPRTTTTKTTARTTTRATATTQRPSVRTTTTTTTTAKPRTTTKPIKTTLLTKRPPAVIPIRKPSAKPNQNVRLPQTDLRPPFPPDSGVTEEPGLFQEFSVSTTAPPDPTESVAIEVDYQDVRPVFPVDFADPFAEYSDLEYDSGLTTNASDSSHEQVPINFVIVNIWNYIAGQLTLVGQQVVPAQMLAGINITNGATIQSSSLPAQILSQLTNLLSPSSTTPAIPTRPTTPRTTTTQPPRPYGGVGNPTLLGIQPSVQLNSTLNDAPVPTYTVPNPSPTYGPPPATTAPSTTYGVPSRPSLSNAPPPSTSYGVPLAPPVAAQPSSTYGVPTAAPIGLGALPSSTYGVPSAAPITLGGVQMFMSNFSSVSTASAPSQTYGAPPVQQPSQSYGAPPVKQPSQTYGPPSQTYGAPSQTYGAPSQSYGTTAPPFRNPQNNFVQVATNHNSPSHGALTSIGLISPDTSASFVDLEQFDLSDFISVAVNPGGFQRPPNRVTSSSANANHNHGSNSQFSQLTLKPPLTAPGPPHFSDAIRKPSKNHQHARPIKTAPNHNLNGGRPQRRPGNGNRRRPATSSPVKVFSTTTAHQGNLNFNTNALDSNKNQFVHASHPLGALLPDFILESLSERVHSVPLEAFSRSAFAPRFEDSVQPGPELHRASPQEAAPVPATTVPSSPAPSPVTPESISRIDDVSTEMTAEEGSSHDAQQFASGPVASEATDNNNASPVSGGVIATRSKHPFATRPYAFGRPSAMELAYGDAIGSRLIPVHTNHYQSPSAPPHPLDVSTGDWQRADSDAASEESDLEADASEQESSSANPTSTTTWAAPSTTVKNKRRFSIQGFTNFMPAAAISAAAISLPMLVGRKKREYSHYEEEVEEPMYDGGGWQEEEEGEKEEDLFVKHFTMENEREMRAKDIASSNCRQLSVDDDSNGSVVATLHHLLVCPGRQSRTLNMILLDGLTRRR